MYGTELWLPVHLIPWFQVSPVHLTSWFQVSPVHLKKSSPAAHYNTPMPVHIYAERSQSLNKFATAALIVTTLHRLKRTVCADFGIVAFSLLRLNSFADYKMVQCTGLIQKKIPCGAKTPRLGQGCTCAALFVVVLNNVCLCIMNTACFTRHVQLLISPATYLIYVGYHPYTSGFISLYHPYTSGFISLYHPYT